MEECKPGVLYVDLGKGERIALSTESVSAYARQYLDTPRKVPECVRKAIDVDCCAACPRSHRDSYCKAVYPTLSVFAAFDRYPSHHPVNVQYLDLVCDCLLSRRTTLQQAMQGVSILSLIDYCEYGSQHRDLFFGVNPLMRLPVIASRIYLNTFWLCGGDHAATRARLSEFVRGLKVTIDCQIKRVRLICKQDSFANAFVLTHVLTEMLDEGLDDLLRSALEEHRARRVAPTTSRLGHDADRRK